MSMNAPGAPGSGASGDAQREEQRGEQRELTDAARRWGSPIKERLRRGEAVFGVTITTTSLDLAARAASVGFDFLWIEMEHSPITLETLRNIVLVTRGLPAAPFARVPVNELWTAKRVLDQGAHGVIFPFTSNVERARQAVAACRYPPAGRRGSGNGLAVTCWPDPDAAGYYDSADENVMVVAVVEEASALEQIDEIAATPGLDVVFIGTSDLSFSLGHRGSQEPAAVRDAIERVRAAAERHGKACGLPVRSPEQARDAMAAGFRFFQVNSELNFFEMGARQLLEPLGRKPGATERGLY